MASEMRTHLQVACGSRTTIWMWKTMSTTLVRRRTQVQCLLLDWSIFATGSCKVHPCLLSSRMSGQASHHRLALLLTWRSGVLLADQLSTLYHTLWRATCV